jgi:hypothetical protein
MTSARRRLREFAAERENMLMRCDHAEGNDRPLPAMKA